MEDTFHILADNVIFRQIDVLDVLGIFRTPFFRKSRVQITFRTLRLLPPASAALLRFLPDFLYRFGNCGLPGVRGLVEEGVKQGRPLGHTLVTLAAPKQAFQGPYVGPVPSASGFQPAVRPVQLLLSCH